MVRSQEMTLTSKQSKAPGGVAAPRASLNFGLGFPGNRQQASCHFNISQV